MIKNQKSIKNLKKLTVILTTHNSRYNFILRSLDHYQSEYGKFKLKIIISDSGSFNDFKTLKQKIDKRNYNLNFKFIHFKTSQNYKLVKRDENGKVKYQYVERLKNAIKFVKTEFVVLAADDDFYFPNYFNKSINFLTNNKSFGSVYGHVLKFELNKFVPFGKINKIWLSSDNNPPNPWLEDTSFNERLNNLGKNPWSWFGWYAVQRTSLLRDIIIDANINKIDGYLFEKYVSFCVATLYRVKKLNIVYSARQQNVVQSETVEPFSYKRNISQYNNFVESCVKFLKKNKKIKLDLSKKIILKITNKDLQEYKKNDTKEILRLARKKFSILNKIKNKIYKPKIETFIDKRLSNPKYFKDIKKEIKYIKKIVEK